MNPLREREEAVARIPVVRKGVEVRVPLAIVLVQDDDVIAVVGVEPDLPPMCTKTIHTTIPRREHMVRLRIEYIVEPIRSPGFVPMSSCWRNKQWRTTIRKTNPSSGTFRVFQISIARSHS